MEIFAAFLTGLFVWLCLFSRTTDARNKARRDAGNLLLSVARPNARRRRITAAVAAIILCVFCAECIAMCMIEGSPGLVSLHWFWCGVAVLSTGAIALESAFHLEFRERGFVAVLWRQTIMWAWDTIEYCRWMGSGDYLFVQTDTVGRSFRVLPEQVDSINAVLGQLVVVRDRRILPKPTGSINVAWGQLVIVHDPADEIINPEFASRRGSVEGAVADGPRSTGIHVVRWQFDLRTLLLLLLAASSAFGWMAVRRQISRQQEQIVARLEQFGPNAEYSGPYVVALRFTSASALADDDLIHVKDLPHLRSLNVSGAPVTNAGLVHLGGLRYLRSLGLQGACITDRGLVHIEGLTRLQWLNLAETQVTDAGLVHLHGLDRLRGINLLYTDVSSVGAQTLQSALPDMSISH